MDFSNIFYLKTRDKIDILVYERNVEDIETKIGDGRGF